MNTHVVGNIIDFVITIFSILRTEVKFPYKVYNIDGYMKYSHNTLGEPVLKQGHISKFLKQAWCFKSSKSDKNEMYSIDLF